MRFSSHPQWKTHVWGLSVLLSSHSRQTPRQFMDSLDTKCIAKRRRCANLQLSLSTSIPESS
eukprot:6179850-Pleurochrysis_carterae.AAC.3